MTNGTNQACLAVTNPGRIVRWMIFFSILAHIGILYAIVPQSPYRTQIPVVESPPVITLVSYHKSEPPKSKAPARQTKPASGMRYGDAKPIPESIQPVLPSVSLPVEIPFLPDEVDIPEPSPPVDLPYSYYDPDIVKPERVRYVEPKYPAILRKMGIEGLVVLEAIILKTGDVVDIHVIRSLHEACDQEAIDAVRQWKYTPGLLNDSPVNIRMHLTVQFAMQDR